MEWNEAQKRAIMTREKNILVSAAAGSGKTAVLTERIKQLITREGVGIDEMLIVTFTNAAAGEMRERIYKGVAEEMEAGIGDAAALQEQLDQIGTACISTFHSFCLEVIRNYFYLTELTPDFRICDDAQRGIFAEEAMDQLLREFFEKRDEGFLAFAGKYSKAGNERGITAMVTMVYSFIQSLPDPFGWLEESTEKLRNSKDETERKTYGSVCVLRDLVKRYDEIFMARKLESNQIDFNDIEHLALGILEYEEPRNEYRERFRHIFVDEYQDTNGVQEELINRICRPDNLFMVGDVKQSIYQFRLADPEIFIEKYRVYKSGIVPLGIKIDLNRNFRSKPPVLDCTNRVMESIMTEENAGISYDDGAKLYPGIDYEKTEYGALEKEPVETAVLVESELQAERSAKIPEDAGIKAAELEAMYICGRIRELLGTEFFDNKENRKKRIGYSDIVILMRSYRGTAELYQEVFQREGIPAYVEGGDGYFETVEISVFVNLLRVIVNRRQDIPLLSVLRSVIFRFSAEEIGRVRAFDRKGLFSEAFLRYSAEGPEEALRSKCLDVLERLQEWRRDSQYLSLRDLLWKVVRESGYYEFVQALPLGMQRRDNLRQLIDKGERYQKNTARGLTDFVRYLEQLELNYVPAAGPRPGGETESYVRLMSIHKSKGLEFPVVFVAGLGKTFNHRKPSGELSLDRNLGLGLRYRQEDNAYYIKTVRQMEIDEAVRAKEIAEEMRILYVAMTRAREKLILVGSVKKLEEGALPGAEKDMIDRKSFLEWICQPMQEAEAENSGVARLRVYRSWPWEVLPEAAEPEAPGEQRPEEGEPERPETDEERRIREEVWRELDFVYAHGGAARMPMKFTATELNRMSRRDEEALPGLRSLRIPVGPQEEGALTPAERGTITHKVLQELELGETGSREEIQAQIDGMTKGQRLTERERDGIRADWIFRFFESSLGQRVKAAEKISREKPFLLWKDYDGETGSIVQGVIDCYFEEEGEIILVDYKTDSMPEDPEEQLLREKAEGYRIQMELYQEAIEESLHKKVKEKHLYFLSIGKDVVLK